MTKKFDILIVGGGPAGASAALRLAAIDSSHAGRILLLDKARFPRAKLCGGGVVREADRFLSYLGVATEVPSVPVHSVRFDYAGGSFLHERRDAFRVVRREEFDHALLRVAAERGVAVHEHETALGFERTSRGIRVSTEHGNYEVRIVIGADGANSRVRRALVPGPFPRRFIALDALVARPEHPADGESNLAVFDFRPAARGVRGYFWEFPCLRDGSASINYGMGGTEWPRAGASLRDLFEGELADRRAVDPVIEGAPIPIYDGRLRQGGPGVLLAGDAMGVDPWLGEGISIAIGSGILAADAAAAGLASGRLDFGDHVERIRRSVVGERLVRHGVIARSFYDAAANDNGLPGWFQRGGMAA